MITAVLLIYAWGHYTSQNNSQKSYFITLNGLFTYSNYQATALVDESQLINIYGLNISNSNGVNFTDMLGETGNITSSNIKYKVFPKSSQQNQIEPIKIGLTVTDTKPGVFQGLMLITEFQDPNFTSIPLTLSTDVVTTYAVIWILVGVFLSLIFWEFIKLKRRTRSTQRVATLKRDSQLLIQNIQPTLAQANTQEFVANIEPLVQNIVERIRLERAKEYLENRYTRVGGARTALLDILSVLFGMVIGFIGLLNNDFVTSIRVINPTVILVLISIGLGIGSIKELVDKPS